MRCHICDKSLSDDEIQVAPDGKGYEPCRECFDIAMSAAYSESLIAYEDDEE